ncbi:MAG: chemotaxis protein CheW [Clostridiales bacterium]|jgi:purine-binding chemotaxis protein CheW|nr:chemotaxis protein CheW [Clostridiales bacterium]
MATESALIDIQEEEDSTKDLYLTFRIAGADYAVEVGYIKEIITICPVTVVPETPPFIKGIINLRGDIVPVISVRARFGQPEIPYDDATCIVVLDFDDYIIGLIVDKVKGVATIGEENISAPPSAKLSFANEFIKNIGRAKEGVTLMLDIYKLLF